MKGYNDSPVENLGSCVAYLYYGNKKYRVLTQVAESKGHMILGRNQALLMRYVTFPNIREPAMEAKANTAIKMVRDESLKSTDGPAAPKRQKQVNPIIPVVQQCSDNKITVDGKTHRLPTTIEYLLQEYSDVFQGIGTLPGEPYHIQLKDDYKPLRHPPELLMMSFATAIAKLHMIQR